MSKEISDIILTGVSILVSGLFTYLVGVITAFINSKIKDKKMAKIASSLAILILNSVQQIFQIYVDTLKKEGKFDKDAQESAKNQAFELINGQLTEEMKEYIKDNFGDVKTYILNQIESTIYKLKNSK